MTTQRRKEILMEKAINALQSIEKDLDEPFIILKSKVAQTARKGAKTGFTWRHLKIDYRVRDEFGILGVFHFIVSNPLTGVQKTYYTKDYIGVSGQMKWHKLASDINHT